MNRVAVRVTDLTVNDPRIQAVALGLLDDAAGKQSRPITRLLGTEFFAPVIDWLRHHRGAKADIPRSAAVYREALMAVTTGALPMLEMVIEFPSVADMVHFKLALGSDYQISEIRR